MVKSLAEPLLEVSHVACVALQQLVEEGAPTVHGAVTSAAQWLEDALPHITRDLGRSVASSVVPSWFLSPVQHVWEFLVLNSILVPMVLFLTLRAPWEVVEPAAVAAPTGTRRPRATLVLDTAIAVGKWVVLVTIGATLVYKLLTNRGLYLLQPCHVLNVLLAIICFSSPAAAFKGPAASHLPSIAFNVYLHSVYGAWLALAMPDTRDLHLPTERFCFYLQHALLVGLPMLLIARRKFHLYRPRVLYSWAWKFAYHVDVLLPASLVFGGNLNYMLVPPPGPLANFGFMYRPVMGLVCILLTALVRYGVVGAVCAISRACRLPGWTAGGPQKEE